MQAMTSTLQQTVVLCLITLSFFDTSLMKAICAIETTGEVSNPFAGARSVVALGDRVTFGADLTIFTCFDTAGV